MPPGIDEIVKIESVTKQYRQGSLTINALQKLSLTISKGEFSALIGPSGSGKTTLLNVIGGLDNVTSGSVFIEGRDITKLSAKELSQLRRDRIGFVFQSYNLVPVMTALENTGFVLDLQKVPPDEKKQRCMQILKEVGLEGYENRRPDELSGGQQQRVAIARAVVSRPAIVLADEPTANLDSKNTASLMDMMLRLNEENATTFLFSTHDERVIRRARRKVTLVDGKIESDDR